MESSKETRMGSAPLWKLMFSLSIPSVIAQIINVLYNIVDRIFIGHIEGVGSTALTGVGITLPVLMLISAFSAFSSVGGSSLASIRLGGGNRKEAEKILGESVWLLCVFTVILMVTIYCFYRPFLYMFGASENTMPYAASYLKIYLAGTFFVEISLGLNTFIIIQGRPAIAMMSILTGALLNIALDPLFIFVLGLGVKGAAVATVISQAVSAAWNLAFLLGRSATLSIKREYVRFDPEISKKIIALGISPFIMRSTESLINIVMNRQLQLYGGDLFVGSLTIMHSLMMLTDAPSKGFTQGVQPVIGYNYGAGDQERVKKTYKRMITICFIYVFAANAIQIIFPEFFGRFFTSDPELIALLKHVVPVFLRGMLIFGLQEAIQATFLALGQARISIFIALTRKVFLLVPLAIILPRHFGVMGVYYAEPLSDILSVTTACLLFFTNIKKILSERR